MSTTPSPTALAKKPGVQIVETTNFLADAKVLNETEYRALLLVLSENPMVGKEVDDMPGLFKFHYCGRYVIYGVSTDLTSIFLLMFSDSPPTPPPGARSKGYVQAKDLANSLVKGGLFAVGKNVVEVLIKIVKDNL